MWVRCTGLLYCSPAGQLGHSADRNTTDKSGATLASLRPDFCLWVHCSLLFKVRGLLLDCCAQLAVLLTALTSCLQGEEKATATQLGLALTELVTKMGVWRSGTEMLMLKVAKSR